MGRTKPLILVVDDESHILHVVSLKLRNAGYDVATACDGEEGLEAALQHLPDLVITDYQMPGLTGLEMCARLKAHGAAGAVPALMLTARGFALDPASIEATNIAGVLSTPFSPREVLARVQDLLAGKTAAEAPEAP